MSKGTRHSGSREEGGVAPSRAVDEKKLVVQFTQSFDENFRQLPLEIQQRGHQTVTHFIDCYLTRQFPKGLRVHKCGPFLSLSISMNYRIFALPITGGIKFVFVGDHEDAERYLKRN